MPQNRIAPARYILPALLFTALAACGENEPEPQKQLDPHARWTREAPAAVNPGIMDEAMDGSSVEAFEADMAKVREQAGKLPYDQLKGAVGYMLTYDLALNRDKAKLYRRLDGKTPNEIIALSRAK